MGSGGAQTLWSPSNEAGAYRVFNRCIFGVVLAGVRPPLKASKAVIDGGILKHEQSY